MSLNLTHIQKKDIQSWDILLSMDRGNTVNVVLNNVDRRYDLAIMRNNPIAIYADGHSYGGSANMKQWFAGIVVGQDPTYEIANKYDITLSCASYFNRLQRKPINTEKYGQNDVNYSQIWTEGINGMKLLNELAGIS